MKRLFLDANVLFTAAHNPKGKAALVLALGQAGHWQVISSRYAVEEARRNLERKFPNRLADFDALLQCLSLVSTPHSETCPLALPAKDRPIFLAALAGSATHLLTGDLQDFGPYVDAPGAASGIVIQTVAKFLHEIP